MSVTLLRCVAGGSALLALAASAPALAQGGWKPDRTVEFIVGTSPGGSIDRIARTMHKILNDQGRVTNATVVNKPGGGGMLGYNYLNQNPGGHHVAVASLTMITNNITGKTPIKYNDVTPLALLVSEYVTFSVRAESPIKSANELIERLKRDPGSISIAVAAALGGSNHIAGGMVIRAAGSDVRKAKFVVFNSSADSMTAVLGGHVDVLATSASTAIPQVQAGKLRMLAVAAPKRMGGALAKVPVWKEHGVNAVFSNWFAAIGPKKMNEAEIAYWDDTLGRLVKTGEWQASLDKFLWVNDYRNSKASRKYFEDQYNEVKAILAELGVVK
ncbi:MAG: tripartite tricarboxylate transporter substrate binding protein [Betaproteobacteria bacterium]|nr:tripartite tricarboxylate transporter substrate binding protein [Betaproteobacteria bacterium]